LSSNILTIGDLDDPVDQSRLDWIGELLAQAHYKPDWTFTLDTDTYVAPAVVIRFLAKDTRNPGQIMAESVHLIIDVPTDAAIFSRWLLAAIAFAEVHEAAENFKMNGKLVADPHAPHNRVWSLAMHDAIGGAARNGQDPFFTVLHAAAVPAVATGAVSPEAIMPGRCTDHLQRNIPLKAVATS